MAQDVEINLGVTGTSSIDELNIKLQQTQNLSQQIISNFNKINSTVNNNTINNSYDQRKSNFGNTKYDNRTINQGPKYDHRTINQGHKYDLRDQSENYYTQWYNPDYGDDYNSYDLSSTLNYHYHAPRPLPEPKPGTSIYSKMFRRGIGMATSAFSSYANYGSQVAGAVGGMDWLSPFGMARMDSQIRVAQYGMLGKAGGSLMGGGATLMGLNPIAGGALMAVGGGLNIAGSMGGMRENVFQGAMQAVGNLGKAVGTILTGAVNLASTAIRTFSNMVRGAVSGLTHLIGMGVGLGIAGVAGVAGVTKGITGPVSDPLTMWTGISLSEKNRLDSMDMAFGMSVGSAYHSQVASQERAAKFRTAGEFLNQYPTALAGMIDFAILDSDINTRINAVRKSMANVQGNDVDRNNLYTLLNQAGFGYELQAANMMDAYGLGGRYYTHPNYSRIERERIQTRGGVLQLNEVNKTTAQGIALSLYNQHGFGKLHVAGTQAFKDFGEGMRSGDFTPALISAAGVLLEAGTMLKDFGKKVGEGVDTIFPTLKPYEKLSVAGGWWKGLGERVFGAITDPAVGENIPVQSWNQVYGYLGEGIKGLYNDIVGMFSGPGRGEDSFLNSTARAAKGALEWGFSDEGPVRQVENLIYKVSTSIRGSLEGLVSGEDTVANRAVATIEFIVGSFLHTVEPVIKELGEIIQDMVNSTMNFISFKINMLDSPLGIGTAAGTVSKSMIRSEEMLNGVKTFGNIFKEGAAIENSSFTPGFIKGFNNVLNWASGKLGINTWSTMAWITGITDEKYKAGTTDENYKRVSAVRDWYSRHTSNELGQRFFNILATADLNDFNTMFNNGLSALESGMVNSFSSQGSKLQEIIWTDLNKKHLGYKRGEKGEWIPPAIPESITEPKERENYLQQLVLELFKKLDEVLEGAKKIEEDAKNNTLKLDITSDDGTRNVSSVVLNNMLGARGKVFVR